MGDMPSNQTKPNLNEKPDRKICEKTFLIGEKWFRLLN